MEYISEPERKTKITHNCEVLVCGGGIAGIAAALAARRNGAKVTLIEREYMLGGLATLGIVTIYLPLCDGCGHQAIYGISEELLKLSISRGIEEHLKQHPSGWLDTGDMDNKIKFRYQVQYNPLVFAADAEQLLLKEGVHILYGTLATDVSMRDSRITHVIVENKSGRSAIECKTVIDCTGDADICMLAGEDCANYTYGNVLSGWYYSHSQDDGVKLTQLSEPYRAAFDNSEEVHNFSGLNAEELSDIMIKSREYAMADIENNRKKDESTVPTMFPTIPQLRMTRRICGVKTVDEEDKKYCKSSIGVTGDWRKRGPLFEIPFEALYGQRVKNLITAGRNISSTDNMWDVTRVIPVCALTGQAAGTAAAMFDDFANADIDSLQDRLYNSGVKLHCCEIL